MSDNPSSPEKQDPAEIIARALLDASGMTHAAAAKAVVQALRAAGWVVVPREPTEAMIGAGWLGGKCTDIAAIWRAMVGAAGG